MRRHEENRQAVVVAFVMAAEEEGRKHLTLGKALGLSAGGRKNIQ